ncbi:putative membrane protein [[Clostridium] bifermentans ATCC 19299]|uniref:hypothetical protein n=1 Tax=Paraclostridium bifermentans TaxID=1490 RepID=UPI00038D693F|nr:hypothetical protein [Paraclostridium bifermentans]EQK44918.1 putative membrane protein [[Clostridium] bifermentans ATCC 19299] [Paraclostridium bifermentans ATCC 19299]
MNNNECSSSKLKELMNVVIFSFAVIGGIVVLAYMYKHYHGFKIIPMGFLEQVFAHVSIYALSVIICFTDIIPMRISQTVRIILTVIITYIFTITYLSQYPINPMGSIEKFIICTVWYSFIVGCVIVAWNIYETITSNKYNKYLKQYQKLKK